MHHSQYTLTQHGFVRISGNENAWKEFEEGKVNLVNLLDQADEKLRNIRKQFDPKAGAEDVTLRLDIAAKTREANEACLQKLMGNVEIICNICSADKKEEVKKTVCRIGDLVGRVYLKVSGKYMYSISSFVRLHSK